MSDQKILEGDPGKLAYFHNPDWAGAPRSEVRNIDPRLCPGCLFPHSMKPTPHVNDNRCEHFRTQKAAGEIESGAYVK